MLCGVWRIFLCTSGYSLFLKVKLPLPCTNVSTISHCLVNSRSYGPVLGELSVWFQRWLAECHTRKDNQMPMQHKLPEWTAGSIAGRLLDMYGFELQGLGDCGQGPKGKCWCDDKSNWFLERFLLRNESILGFSLTLAEELTATKVSTQTSSGWGWLCFLSYLGKSARKILCFSFLCCQ